MHASTTAMPTSSTLSVLIRMDFATAQALARASSSISGASLNVR